jgi:hypothetical protein
VGFGISIKLAPGVRVRASTRGVRASVGPRAARVHVGGGRTTVSSGVGPFTVSAMGGRRGASTTRSAVSRSRASGGASGGAQRVTLAQLERQARAAAREQEIAAVAATEKVLTELHLEQFPDATRTVLPLPPVPTAADLAERRAAAARQAVAGIGWFKRAERRAATAAATTALDDLARREHLAAVISTQRQQIDVDADWQALQDHAPQTVIAAVDQAFADNASDSTCVDAGRDELTGAAYVTCVVVFGTADLVPEQKPALTPGGKPTLRKRTKTDRNEVYTRALASTVLATAKEALAVAPATDEARVLVIRKDAGAATPADYVGVIYVGRFSRAALRKAQRHTADPVELLLSAGDAQLRRKGAAKEVVNLSVGSDPDLQQLLDDFASTLS